MFTDSSIVIISKELFKSHVAKLALYKLLPKWAVADVTRVKTKQSDQTAVTSFQIRPHIYKVTMHSASATD